MAGSDTNYLLEVFGDVVSQSINTASAQPVYPKASNGVKKTRRRGPSASQQLKALANQLQAVEAQFVEQAQANVFLKERERMLQLVIEVKEAQMQRARQVQAGDFPTDIFHAMGMTVEEVRSTKPVDLVNRFTTICSSMALRLAKAMPLLDRYPQLLDAQEHPIKRLNSFKNVMRQSSGSSSSSSGSEAITGSILSLSQGPDVQTTSTAGSHPKLPRVVEHLGIQLTPIEQEQLQVLQQIVDELAVLHKACNYAFWLAPSWILGAQVHVNTLSQQQNWESVAASVSSNHFSIGPGNNLVPVLATDSHWQKVVASMRLSTAQRLQAAALWNIISSGLKDVLQQRAQLMQALTQTPHGTHKANDAVAMQRAAWLSQPSAGKQALSSCWKTAEERLQDVVLMDQLNNTLVKERCLYFLASEIFFQHIISPVQCVYGLVNCFPFIPDDLAALYAAASEYQPSAMTLETLQSLQSDPLPYDMSAELLAAQTSTVLNAANNSSVPIVDVSVERNMGSTLSQAAPTMARTTGLAGQQPPMVFPVSQA